MGGLKPLIAKVTLSSRVLEIGLGALITAAMSGAVSLIITTERVGALKEQAITESVQVRELMKLRDKADEIKDAATKGEFVWIKDSLRRLEDRINQKFGGLEGSGAYRVKVGSSRKDRGMLPDILVPAPAPSIFDDEINDTRQRLDYLLSKLKETKEETPEEQDERYRLEIEYEVLKVWRLVCGVNTERGLRCQKRWKERQH